MDKLGRKHIAIPPGYIPNGMWEEMNYLLSAQGITMGEAAGALLIHWFEGGIRLEADKPAPRPKVKAIPPRQSASAS